MAGKEKLAGMFDGDPPKPEIRRGQGVRLSTDQPAPVVAEEQRENAEAQERTAAEPQNGEIAETQKRRIAETQSGPKRVNRGYMLREDLIKACKMLAVQEERNLYEVMEDALEQYLERHQAGAA